MSDDYILKYTNGYANYGTIDDDNLTVIGDCAITNYDPRVEDGKKRGRITINLFGGEQAIMEGTGNGYKECEQANFSKKKFSIFAEITSLDEKEGLSLNDIEKIDKSYKEKWGLKDLRLDYKHGVATLVWGENDILRIDFLTRKDKSEKSKEVAKPKNDTITQNKTKIQKETTVQSEVVKSVKSKDNPEVAKILSKFTGGNIPIDKVCDLNSVAEYTGISEDYIRDILVGIEGKDKWPLCVAEFDNVPKKGFPKGFLTIGFGHTSLAGEPKVTEGLEVSEKQAYQILANDIMSAVKICKNKFKNRGMSFDTIPHSIQCAIIDIVFNKGPSEINESLIANIKNGYLGAAARRTWYDTPVVGLQKRNMYRFIAALESLGNKEKKSAIKRFKADHSAQLQRVFQKDPDAKIAWNDMCNEIPYKDGKI
ncbi:hypothetical protein IJD34_05535 [bacterium]|nr:hypothetical protein [bacterium]